MDHALLTVTSNQQSVKAGIKQISERQCIVYVSRGIVAG